MKKLILVAAATALALTACSSPAPAADDGLVHIVASTNVYGDIASAIGGDHVEVTSIIDDPSQDPHSFEGDVRVQLALSKADLVIENGGGYDDFADTLLAGADNPDAVVLNVTDLSGYDQAEGFNEHFWYDFPTMRKLVDQLVADLSAAAPEGAATFESNAAELGSALEGLELREADLKQRFAGTGVAITEPVPGHMLAASGLEVVTPPDFSEAIEEGTDVSPLVLADTLALFADGTAALLVYNEQTTGPQTEAVLAAAEGAGTPVVPVTETLPDGEDYIGWMTANLDAIEAALS